MRKRFMIMRWGDPAVERTTARFRVVRVWNARLIVPCVTAAAAGAVTFGAVGIRTAAAAAGAGVGRYGPRDGGTVATPIAVPAAAEYAMCVPGADSVTTAAICTGDSTAGATAATAIATVTGCLCGRGMSRVRRDSVTVTAPIRMAGCTGCAVCIGAGGVSAGTTAAVAAPSIATADAVCGPCGVR